MKNMKKYIFLATATLVALAACSKVDPVAAPVQEEAITFNVVNYANSTKADNFHLEFTGADFGAYAWVTETNWATNGDATFFWTPNNQKIEKNSAGKWSTSTPYFWPKQAKLSFASYAPYKSSGAPTYTKANGWAMETYTIVDATNEDLMFADLVTDLTANATTAEVTKNDGGYHFAEGVPTLFRHKLTRVNFQFALAEDASKFENISDVYVVVNKASIVNIKKTGAYASDKWTPTSATAEYKFVTSDKELKTKNEFKDADAKDRILLPQELVASAANAPGQQLKISYTIYTTYVGANTPLVETITDELYDLKGTKVAAWNPNNDILYKVSIYPTEQKPIYFDPAVKAWDPLVEQAIDVNKPE